MQRASGRLKLVLAEASLETVPRELWSHPAVHRTARRRGKKPGEMILDSSLHHQAMKRLPGAEKRGRPDIVHLCLLEALSSPLNKAGLLEVYIHTVNDYIIEVDPETRPPRNYNRFIGLMEQLFREGAVPPGAEKPLMLLKPMKLPTLVRRLKPSRTILITDHGERKRLREIASIIAENPAETLLIIGAFPHGDYTQETYSLATHTYTFHPKPLDPWVKVSHTLALTADALGVI